MDARPGRERLPRALWLLLAARVVNRLGAFSLPFLTVLVSTDFGASAAQAGAVTAAFGVATIPSRLAGGWLADRLGRRRTIVLGMAGCALTQIGIATASSFGVVAAFAVLLGLCYELYEPPSQAIIAESVGAERRPQVFSMFNAALAAGGMGAGLLAAGLGQWDLRWLFVADAVSCLGCAVILQLALPLDRPRWSDRAEQFGDTARERDTIREVGVGIALYDEATATAGDGVAAAPNSATARVDNEVIGATATRDGAAKARSPWRDRPLLAMLASGTVYALIYLQIMMLLPLTLERRGLRPSDAGLLFTASAATIIAAQPLLRIRRLATLRLPLALALGYALLAAGLAGYALSGNQAVALAATVVWSLGDLAFMGRAYGHVATLAPAGSSGRYLAVYGTSWGIAGIAAPIVGTQILAHGGITALWGGLAAVSTLMAVGHALTSRRAAARRPRAATVGDPASSRGSQIPAIAPLPDA